MKVTSNAKCDKIGVVNHDCSTGGCSTTGASAKSKSNLNMNSKIASYPLASDAKTGGQSIMTPQPDINKVLAKDESPVVQIPLAASPSGARRLPGQKMTKGNKLVLAGRYDEAARAFREALNMKPDLEEAHIKLAGIYQYQKLYTEAIEEYKDAIAINPSNPDNYVSAASLYAKIGEFDKAAEACEIVIRMAPGTPKAKTAQNLYETFKRQSAPSDNKMILRADNIQSLNFDESSDEVLKLDVDYDKKPVKKVSKSSAARKTSSKATTAKKSVKSSAAEAKTKSKTAAIGKIASAKSDILDE